MNSVPLPQYQSHKKVWAAKVVELKKDDTNDEVCKNDTGWLWTLDNGGYVHVTHDLKMRGGEYPQGGYYVRYEDGFQSWSPAEAFENGYTLIKGEE